MKQGKKYGSHSNTHPHVNKLSYEKNIEEIELSNDKLEKIIGKSHPKDDRWGAGFDESLADIGENSVPFLI